MKHSKGIEDGLLLYQRPYTGVGNLPETPEFIIRVKIEDYNRWIKGIKYIMESFFLIVDIRE